MKNIDTLKAIKDFIKKDKFIVVEEANMIYLNLDMIARDLNEAYQKAMDIAQQFDAEVILHFNGFDMVVNKNTTIENLEIQYKKAHEIHYQLYTQNEFKKATKNLTVKNANRKLKEVSRLINDDNGFKKYIEQYELNELSKALYNAYKSKEPDEYLDSMVEDAKILKKTQSLNCSMNSK